jgi:hypothetical protein
MIIKQLGLRSMRSPAHAALLALFTLLGCSFAQADDQPFLTVYTTDIQPEGGRELEQWLKWKSGHAGESFNHIESRTEFEYGITDDLQGSLYLNYEWERIHPHMPLQAADSSDMVGVSGELLWRVMNPYFDPFGLAFYVEPSIGESEREFETKILFQKNFFNDTLRWAINVNFEDTWENAGGGIWSKESALEFNTGLAYNVTPDFSVGVEFDNERGYDGLILGGSASPQTDSYYFGPTIQYIGHPWAITLSAQAQLPWARNPSHAAGNVVDGLTAGDEHFRLALKVATDL